MTSSRSDDDGDSLSVTNVAALSVGSGVTVSTTTTGVRLTVPQTVTGSQQISFKLYDGLHYSSSLTFTVVFTNTAPVCSAASITVAKGASVSVSSLLSSSVSDANGDALTVSLVNSGSYPAAFGSFSGLTYTAANINSGVNTQQYQVTDTQATATCALTITTVNNAPVATNANYSIVISKTTTLHTFDYIGDGKATDVDSYDSLKLSLVSSGCSSLTQNVSIVNNQIYFYRKVLAINGSCSIVINVTDNDISNPKSAIATVKFTLVSTEPVAKNDWFQIDQGQTIRIYVSELLANDTDEFGSSNGLSFVSFYCPTTGSYCHNTPTLVTVNGLTAIELASDTSSCQADKFRYIMQTASGIQREADVYVEFKNCKLFLISNLTPG